MGLLKAIGKAQDKVNGVLDGINSGLNAAHDFVTDNKVTNFLRKTGDLLDGKADFDLTQVESNLFDTLWKISRKATTKRILKKRHMESWDEFFKNNKMVQKTLQLKITSEDKPEFLQFQNEFKDRLKKLDAEGILDSFIKMSNGDKIYASDLAAYFIAFHKRYRIYPYYTESRAKKVNKKSKIFRKILEELNPDLVEEIVKESVSLEKSLKKKKDTEIAKKKKEEWNEWFKKNNLKNIQSVLEFRVNENSSKEHIEKVELLKKAFTKQPSVQNIEKAYTNIANTTDKETICKLLDYSLTYSPKLKPLKPYNPDECNSEELKRLSLIMKNLLIKYMDKDEFANKSKNVNLSDLTIRLKNLETL